MWQVLFAKVGSDSILCLILDIYYYYYFFLLLFFFIIYVFITIHFSSAALSTSRSLVLGLLVELSVRKL